MAVRFDLWASERERAEVKPNGVRVLIGDNPPTAKLWLPKATKPAANYRFRSTEQRDKYVKDFVAGQDAHLAEVAKRREAKRATPEQRAQIQADAIFVYSWGYEQTNVDALQVVEVKGGGSTVVVRQIGTTMVYETAHMAGQVKPVPGSFLKKEPPITKRVQFSGSGPHLSMDHGNASLWDGERSYYRSWYG